MKINFSNLNYIDIPISDGIINVHDDHNEDLLNALISKEEDDISKIFFSD
jgi:hypothetical protein